MLVLSSCDHELSWIGEAGVRASGLGHHLQRGRLLVKCACLFVVTSIDLSSINYSCSIDNAMFAVVSMRCGRLVLLTWYDKLGRRRIKWILSYHLLNVLGVKCSLGTLNNIRLMLVLVVTTWNSFNRRLKLEKLVIWVLAIMRRYRCDFSAYNAWRRLRKLAMFVLWVISLDRVWLIDSYLDLWSAWCGCLVDMGVCTLHNHPAMLSRLANLIWVLVLLKLLISCIDTCLI